VLVELFTSEGCSDCPPADALLARLDSTQFVPGAEAIVLSEHVTYWDRLGWRDPFSSDTVTERQRQYATHFGLSDVYTPQMVVDGSAQFVGSDAVSLEKAIARAAASPKPEIQVEDIGSTDDTVHFSARAPAGLHGTLVAALAEDAATSAVARGENAGRTLHHVAVVRVLKAMGTDAAAGRSFTLKLPGEMRNASQSANLRLVVFLADRHSGHILAVAEHPVTR